MKNDIQKLKNVNVNSVEDENSRVGKVRAKIVHAQKDEKGVQESSMLVGAEIEKRESVKARVRAIEQGGRKQREWREVD